MPTTTEHTTAPQTFALLGGGFSSCDSPDTQSQVSVVHTPRIKLDIDVLHRGAPQNCDVHLPGERLHFSSPIPPEAPNDPHPNDDDHDPEHEELDLGLPSPVQLETTGLSSHFKHLPKTTSFRPAPGRTEKQQEFWRTQTAHKESISAKLHAAGRGDLAIKLDACHQHDTFAHCNGCGKVRRFTNHCDTFYCPECAPQLSRQRIKQIKWWTETIAQPKHVVLTLRNFPEITPAIVKHAKKCLSRLRRSKFCNNWRGGFYSMEITNEGRGWHLHFHLLIDARYIDARELARQWERFSGGWGNIVKVKDARGQEYLAEVAKYIVKGSQMAAWPQDEIVQFITALLGVRTFGVFGQLYGKRTEWREWIKQITEKGMQCECGCTTWTYFDEHRQACFDAGIPWTGPPK